MKLNFSFQGSTYFFNTEDPIRLSLPLSDDGNNPNCYYADPVRFETISSGDFIGSVAQGGSVNYQKIHLTPHGNGTHTESYAHIAEKASMINHVVNTNLMLAQLVTVSPDTVDGDEIVCAIPDITNGVEALIIRTLPNTADKKTRQYSGTNPPYIRHEAIRKIVGEGIKHLLIDLPSIDKEVDGGALLAHRAFWSTPERQKTCSITELIFVENKIEDGLYMLNLQLPNMTIDACPSNPVIFKLFKS